MRIGRDPARPQAAVIGGSLGGLFAALLLRRAGWQVRVFERIGEELSGRGAGIVTHDDLFAVLRHAGINVVPADLGVPVPGRRVFDRSGRVAGELRLGQVLTSWGRLYALLRSSLPAEDYRGGVTLRRVEEHPDHVVAECDDGSRFRSRPAGRGRRSLLDGASTIPTRNRAALRRLHRLARLGRRGRLVGRYAPYSVRLVCIQLARRRANAGLPGRRRRRSDGYGTASVQLRLVPARGARRGFA